MKYISIAIFIILSICCFPIKLCAGENFIGPIIQNSADLPSIFFEYTLLENGICYQQKINQFINWEQNFMIGFNKKGEYIMDFTTYNYIGYTYYAGLILSYNTYLYFTLGDGYAYFTCSPLGIEINSTINFFRTSVEMYKDDQKFQSALKTYRITDLYIGINQRFGIDIYLYKKKNIILSLVFPILTLYHRASTISTKLSSPRGKYFTILVPYAKIAGSIALKFKIGD